MTTNLAKNSTALAVPSLFILVLMISLGPFGDTIYSPSLPQIAQAFGAPYHNVQLTITFYLLGYSLSQILYGPFSDRFGRRPIMIIGSAFFVLGSTLCLYSPDIKTLIFSRFLQGFGACAGAVISSAAVRDAFSPHEQGKVFAKMNAAFAIAPGAGAIVGVFISWKMSFMVLFILSLLLFLCVILLFPETLKQKNYGAVWPKKLFKTYINLYKAPGYFIYLCLLGLNISMVYSCLVEAPGIVIHVLQLQKIWFIVIASGIVVAFMVGSILCTYLCHRINQNMILLIGMMTSLSGSIVLLVLMSLGIVSLWSLLCPVIFIFIGIAFVIPVATAKALAPFELTAGAASAMMGFFQMGAASLITAIITLLPFSDTISLSLSFTVLTSIGILILIFYIIKLKRQA